jgi:branched-chain amino acid transport system permease protein
MMALFLLMATIPLLGASEYLLSFLFVTLMYASLATGWNIIGGYAGYLSFGHAAFFGLGGYVTGLTLLYWGWSPFVTAILAAAVAASVALAVGYPVLRLKGPYFALVTLLLAMVARLVVMNLPWTQGAQGFWLPAPEMESWTNRAIFFEVMLGLAAATLAIAYAVLRSKFGLGLAMIREDEEAAQTLGVDATRLKLTAFASSAGLAAIVGGIFAYYRTYVHPNHLFDLYLSVNVVLMALFGGRRNWYGPAIGAFALSIVSEVLTVSIGTEVARVAFGLLLVVVVMAMPDGITALPRLIKQAVLARRQATSGRSAVTR